jgi:hypothetical protein
MADQLDSPPQRSRQPHAPLPTASVDTPAPAAPELAADDPRARARARAAELREHGALDEDGGTSEFHFDTKIIPDGWSYEWKRLTVLGATDPGYQVNLARAGWEPVPAARHRELMPDGHKGNTIERSGQILMERPKEITDAAYARELSKARGQVRGKEEQLHGAPSGTFGRDNKGSPLVKVGKSYDMPIPEK